MSPTHEPLTDSIMGLPTGKSTQNAAEKAFNRAVQALGLLAVLDRCDLLHRAGVAVVTHLARRGRGDLLTTLSEEITRREKDMG